MPGHDEAVRPVVPVPGPLPVGPEWSYEVDWAGVRLLADVDEGHLVLRTPDGEDVTARFPEFASLERTVADGLFDGEAVLLDGGSPSALALGERLRVADPRRARSLARRRPAVFLVYDLLRLYGVPLDLRSLDDRRATLGRLDLSAAGRVQVSPTYEDGPALLAGVAAQGLSGVVAKRRDAPYDPDDADWVRVVPPRRRPGHARPDPGMPERSDRHDPERRPTPDRGPAHHAAPEHGVPVGQTPPLFEGPGPGP